MKRLLKMRKLRAKKSYDCLGPSGLTVSWGGGGWSEDIPAVPRPRCPRVAQPMTEHSERRKPWPFPPTWAPIMGPGTGRGSVGSVSFMGSDQPPILSAAKSKTTGPKWSHLC